MITRSKIRVKSCKDDIPECITRHLLGSVIRADEDGDSSISGYALKWGDTYDLFGDGSYVESFKRGAFKDAIENEHPIFLLRQHEGSAIASTQNDTLELSEDKEGLAFRARLNLANSEANDAYINTKDGTSNGVSIGFSMRNMEYEVEKGDGETKVNVTSVDRLFEISLVHTPAYTSSDARSLLAADGGDQQPEGATDAGRDVEVEALRLRLNLIGG